MHYSLFGRPKESRSDKRTDSHPQLREANGWHKKAGRSAIVERPASLFARLV